MTAPAAIQEGEQVERIQLALDVLQAQKLEAVLPWLLQALEDRPNLTPKQSRRRETTRTALTSLLTQLRERLLARAPGEGLQNGQ